MKSVLKIEQHQTRTLKWWNSRREKIDFDPPYQRKGRLWSDQDKAFLIDSILNGFDIPKLYLADFQFGESSLNEKRLPYAIIDGKQRLEAIFDFFDNKLTLAKEFKWRDDATLSLGGLSLRDLYSKYPEVAEEFENANLTIMSVFTDDETLINDLFVRLNRSKSLTGAEVRNAIVGPVTDVIRELAQHSIFKETIRFSTKRAGDHNAAAKVLLFEYRGHLTGTKKIDLDNFAKIGTVDRERLELSARRAIDIFDEMSEIFIPNDVLLGSAGTFPVYYWFVRGVSSEFQDDIRHFLIEFENSRKENREKERLHGEGRGLNAIYSRYDTLNRSTNDLGSHKGRVEILREEFVKYLNNLYELEEDQPFRNISN
ncbi:DUF262 domain-containing protein [Novosphingobium sp. KN65.2]|uniref:DUF262 domain-containing protein n=1 Tax=Novosphingobium sp. KN65.2 TaxID=1478134 RepID=UPI0005E54A77|nr:DUF262 domain-containing protein [Novosphingobium sp. KN65.2]CDO36927.1 conserved hypothetical protein [Novosphingobium sp. KN65.2]